MKKAIKPQNEVEAVKQGWVYEDELPVITDFFYDLWFAESLVLSGVRMGPFPKEIALRAAYDALQKFIDWYSRDSTEQKRDDAYEAAKLAIKIADGIGKRR